MKVAIATLLGLAASVAAGGGKSGAAPFWVGCKSIKTVKIVRDGP